MGKLSGKVAVVTGGAGGIGRAIVDALAAECADIGVVDKNADGASSVAMRRKRGPHSRASQGRWATSISCATTLGLARAALSLICRSICGIK